MDQVADVLSHVLGQSIQHESLSDDKLRNSMIRAGMSGEYAAVLAGLDVPIREEGREDQTTDTVKKLTGNNPISFEQFT